MLISYELVFYELDSREMKIYVTSVSNEKGHSENEIRKKKTEKIN